MQKELLTNKQIVGRSIIDLHSNMASFLQSQVENAQRPTGPACYQSADRLNVLSFKLIICTAAAGNAPRLVSYT